MFEFPKGINYDLLDGLWYAVTTAKPPKSNALDIDKFEERMSNREKNVASRAVSWITGQKI